MLAVGDIVGGVGHWWIGVVRMIVPGSPVRVQVVWWATLGGSDRMLVTRLAKGNLFEGWYPLQDVQPFMDMLKPGDPRREEFALLVAIGQAEYAGES